MKTKHWRQGVILSCASWEFLASILWSGSLAQSTAGKKKSESEKSITS
ncbi:MAG: hypothetical protein PHD29_00150 [bacterium]|nr:hypothetical protein [bacterium]MDD5354772.1 hypothetical protein [bacterium]MDD5757311.1 hypothetical protein [bacterium]